MKLKKVILLLLMLTMLVPTPIYGYQNKRIPNNMVINELQEPDVRELKNFNNNATAFALSTNYTERELLLELNEMIKEALLSGKKTIDLSSLKIECDKFSEVASLLYYSPYLCRGIDCTVWYSGNYYVKIDLNYSLTSQQVKTIITSVDKKIDEILSLVNQNMSDEQKALVIHDYFAYQFEYDTSVTTISTNDSFRSGGLFLNEKGVCQAYGYAYKYIMERLGIDCYYTKSKEMNHGWNIIKIGGAYYHVDTTYDDPLLDKFGQVRHYFFLLSDSAIKQVRGEVNKSHYGWDLARKYPCNNTRYDNAYWKEVKSQIVVNDNYAYYIVNNSIMKRNLTSNTTTSLFNSFGDWPTWNQNGHWIGNFSGFFMNNNKLYFNTYNKIYSIDKNGGNKQVVYSPSVTSGYIYGIRDKAGVLQYKLSVDPNSNGKIYNSPIQLVVPQQPQAVLLDKSAYTMNKSTVFKLTATILPQNVTADTLTWSSSNNNVAKVDSTGKVTAINTGTAVITVKTSNGKTATCRVTVVSKAISVGYATHIQNVGWQIDKYDGEMSGTSGEAKRLEAIKIYVLNNMDYSGGIEYQTHIQNVGWQSWKTNGEISGTSGEAKRLEAIRIRLTGKLSEYYDVYYRVHAQNNGWLDWAKNGESAGTAGYGYRLEGIEIVLVEKGRKAPGSTERPFVQRYIGYSTHVQNVGWQEKKYDGQTSGTNGESKRLEAITISLENQKYNGDIEYSTHVQNIGWQVRKRNGQMSGTNGESKRLEAIKIKLTGEMAEKYDIYYRVHAQNNGWLGWAKNDDAAGTAGYGYRLEAIEIKLVEKNKQGPISTQPPFKSHK